MKRMGMISCCVIFLILFSSCNHKDVSMQADHTATASAASTMSATDITTALHMPDLITISGCYEGEFTIIKPTANAAIMIQTGEQDAVIVELSEQQLRYLNETYESITDFSESSEMSSTSIVTVKANDQLYSFGLGCANQQMLNDYIEYLLSLDT